MKCLSLINSSVIFEIICLTFANWFIKHNCQSLRDLPPKLGSCLVREYIHTPSHNRIIRVDGAGLMCGQVLTNRPAVCKFTS